MEKKEQYYFLQSSEIKDINTVDTSEVKDCIVALKNEIHESELASLKNHFRLVVAFLENVEPKETEEYTVVPTLNEAEDYLFMQQIEAELGDL
jgi:hypothetical protein